MGLKGKARFLSHIEALNARIRALRRVKMPLGYSQGFHPHPKVAFAGARPVAEETEAEYMDVVLSERLDPQEALSRLQSTLPEGFEAYDVQSVPLRAPSLGARVTGARYLFMLSDSVEDLEERISTLLEAEQVMVQRRNKKKKGKRRRFSRDYSPFKQVDLRPHIRAIDVLDRTLSSVPDRDLVSHVLNVELDVLGGRGARPSEIIGLLGLERDRVHVIRKETRLQALADETPPAKAEETA
jgi:radical SAM-linked protein